jgi:hypothetical protein
MRGAALAEPTTSRAGSESGPGPRRTSAPTPLLQAMHFLRVESPNAPLSSGNGAWERRACDGQPTGPARKRRSLLMVCRRSGSSNSEEPAPLDSIDPQRDSSGCNTVRRQSNTIPAAAGGPPCRGWEPTKHNERACQHSN